MTDDKFVEIERSLVSEADSSCLVYAERYLAVTCLRQAFFFLVFTVKQANFLHKIRSCVVQLRTSQERTVRLHDYRSRCLARRRRRLV